jgi:hypothetical protein
VSSSFRFAAPFLPPPMPPLLTSLSPTWLPGFLVTHHIRQSTCNALCCISTTSSVPSPLRLLSAFDCHLSLHGPRMDERSRSGRITALRAPIVRPHRIRSTEPTRAWGSDRCLRMRVTLPASTSAYILPHIALVTVLLLYTTCL